MKTFRPFRLGGIAACLTAIVISLNGCLECKDSVLGRYDADKDQFVFLNIYQRIGAQSEADVDHLEKLWKNRDHLITPPFPTFFGKTSYLRVSNTEAAQLNLGSAGSAQIFPSPLPLDEVTVLPGQFFSRGKEAVCYYDQIVVPGTFMDATLKLLNKSGREGVAGVLAEEKERRAKGGKLATWEAVRQAINVETLTFHASATVDPAPAKPGAAQAEAESGGEIGVALSDASLEKLIKATTDDSVGLVRDKAMFRLSVTLDENDAKEVMATIAFARAKMADALKKPNHEPDLDKQASLLALIEASSPKPGVVELRVDATKLFTTAETLQAPKDELPAPSSEEEAHARLVLTGMKARNIPIDDKTTVEGIVTAFHAKTLAGHPPEHSVPAGEGLTVR